MADDLATINASAWKPCPASIPREGWQWEHACSPDCTGQCEGRGWVYVLDGVRVPCSRCGGKGEVVRQGNQGLYYPFCELCDRRGWTPEPNGWTWWDEAWDYFACVGPNAWQQFIADWQKEWFTSSDIDPSPKTAFDIVFHQALEAMGARFLETRDAP